MSADEILTAHLELCEDTYQILSEENHLLQRKDVGFGEDFISRKTDLLKRLDSSLQALKNLNANPMTKSEHTNSLIKKGQQKLMKILLLDRENERLLNTHKGDSKERLQKVSLKDQSMKRIQKAYEKYDNIDEELEESDIDY